MSASTTSSPAVENSAKGASKHTAEVNSVEGSTNEMKTYIFKRLVVVLHTRSYKIIKDARTGLCMLLTRLAYPNRISDLAFEVWMAGRAGFSDYEYIAPLHDQQVEIYT
ncbi:hypothetical protein L211DRAFT_563125 [Terfezia boudieri ATCC MYA-4762]|uniref:Uncharacterized protein n=1 Tax=Terfezia boudieri ATCC MYA-4762 TaxID=1051890 RepID=A0A3N4M2N8_9PEZI|nr:hypothetical protein L211DRAFT_563125 [Terfezia boudieri ATCC MYA-4762]